MPLFFILMKRIPTAVALFYNNKKYKEEEEEATTSLTNGCLLGLSFHQHRRHLITIYVKLTCLNASYSSSSSSCAPSIYIVFSLYKLSKRKERNLPATRVLLDNIEELNNIDCIYTPK